MHQTTERLINSIAIGEGRKATVNLLIKANNFIEIELLMKTVIKKVF